MVDGESSEHVQLDVLLFASVDECVSGKIENIYSWRDIFQVDLHFMQWFSGILTKIIILVVISGSKHPQITT